MDLNNGTRSGMLAEMRRLIKLIFSSFLSEANFKKREELGNQKSLLFFELPCSNILASRFSLLIRDLSAFLNCLKLKLVSTFRLPVHF